MAIDLLPVLSDGWVPLLTRLTLGGLLFAAGWTKFRQPQRFEATLEQLGLDDETPGGRPTRATALRVIPAAECALGGMLLAGWLTQPAAVGAAALLGAFAVAVAGAARRRVPVDLHCGPGLSCRVSGWTVARNGLMAAAALLLLAGAPDPLSLDALLSGAAAPLPLGEGVAALGLWLFVVAAGSLVPAAAGLLRGPRAARQGGVS